jgi:ABC-type dipeptide/oligopeptide/nickel transport systems, permease components
VNANEEHLNTEHLSDNAAGSAAESESLKAKLLDMCRNNKLAVISAVVILLYILACTFANFVAPYDPNKVSLLERLKAPSAAHWFGTDDCGRDVLTRVLYGGRISLQVGLIPTFISMVIGTILGLISGFFGKKTDFLIMRLADIVLAFPSLLLAMVVMYTLGASTLNLFIALSIISWAGTARVVRSQTLSLKEEEFIEAANSMGVKRGVIMLRHILPNCLSTLIVLFTLNIPGSILSEASLSFLGVGAQPPDTSWGLMISQGQQYFFQSPWLIIAPGMAILVVVLAFNFLGDGLRDAIDPYSNE